VIERALETAAVMLGSDKSRGLSGDDLRGLSGGREPGQRQPRNLAEFDDPVLQVLAR
jgi:hypothetical protein